MNNNRYDGMWFQDYQHGAGTMYYHNGDLYVGNWANDKREGEGTYTWANGAKYSGHWKTNMTVTGQMISSMEKVLIFSIREIATKVLIFWENVPEKAFTIMPMEINM